LQVLYVHLSNVEIAITFGNPLPQLTRIELNVYVPTYLSDCSSDFLYVRHFLPELTCYFVSLDRCVLNISFMFL
jgi:hypothetical protein